MLTETFDKDTEQMISPEAVYGVREKVCDICIVTFSDVVVEEIRKNFDCTTVAEIGSVNGGRPIYLLEYKGKKIAFYMTMISSAAAGACLEEARCLTGAGSYIMFGSCGALNREITAGKIIVPTQAYRDEGLSYHYAPPADYITMNGLRKWDSPMCQAVPGPPTPFTGKQKQMWIKEKRKAVLPWKWNVPVCRQSAISEALTCIIT